MSKRVVKQISMTAAMAAALLALPGCSSNDSGWEEVVAEKDTAVCLDAEDKRVEDSNCTRQASAQTGAQSGGHMGGGGIASAFMWYYIARNARVPFLGDSVRDQRFARGGSFVADPSTRYANAPSAANVTRSQAVSRGGLGARSSYFGSGRS